MATLQSINPHDQSVVGELLISSATDVASAVADARMAYHLWRRTPIEKRIEYIKKFRDLVALNKEKIGKTQTLEMGKPLDQSLSDIDQECEFLDYYTNKGPENLADEVMGESEKERFRVVYEPYGVVAVIAPWNFPLGMACSGIIPALIAGNTVVFKPSEYTSLSQKIVVDLLREAGLPEGVANLVIGGAEVGRMLVDAPVALVWFTGSTSAGQEIYKKCGEKFIKALLELGGSNPGIIFADADLDALMNGLFYARFFNCGQVCSAVKRMFVERPIYETFVQKYVERLRAVKIGNPLDAVDLGPLVNKKQLAGLEAQVADAVAKGAKVEIGGKRPSDPALVQGNYYEPTVLTSVTPDMKVLTEEVFGPVLPVVPFDTEEEAVRLANTTPYGLGSEIFTNDLARAERPAHELESGVVSANNILYYRPFCPIGGMKQSGMGREYGRIGMQEFAQVKLIALPKV